jgi:VanZ family protein
MLSSGILRRVALARTDVSEELSASIIRVTHFVFLRSVRRLLVRASVVPSSPILHSHRREYLKSYIPYRISRSHSVSFVASCLVGYNAVYSVEIARRFGITYCRC